jgi:hypothetical protein
MQRHSEYGTGAHTAHHPQTGSASIAMPQDAGRVGSTEMTDRRLNFVQ